MRQFEFIRIGNFIKIKERTRNYFLYCTNISLIKVNDTSFLIKSLQDNVIYDTVQYTEILYPAYTGTIDSYINLILSTILNEQNQTDITSAVNLGTGEIVFSSKVGPNLQFKTLKAGSNILLTPSSDEIEISLDFTSAVTADVVSYNNLISGLISTDVQNAIDELDSIKQDTLISGTNIKTINGNTLLGSGNLSITASISDGDKGDITVSGTGTVWTIDSNAVTDSKIASGITASKITQTSSYRFVTDAEKSTWNGKQDAISLTTTGNSGASTFITNTLNIPTYTLAGLGGISLTSLSATSPLSYNNLTGIFSIQVATSGQNGYLSSSDWSTFNNKENALTAGTSAQYYRGDKTWQTLDTLAVTENTNLYFNNARAIAATLTGYTSGAGVISSSDSILSAIQKLNGNIAALPSYTFSTGLTNLSNTITSNISTGISGGQTIYGGINSSENLTISSTTNATKGTIQIGSTDLVNIGNAVTTNQRLVRIGQDTATVDIGSLVGTGTVAAVYLNKATPSSSNYTLHVTSGDTVAINGAFLTFKTSNVNRLTFDAATFNVTPGGSTNTTTGGWSYTGGANINQPLGTESIGVRWNLSATRQWATGTITTQREVVIDAPTYGFVGASTITNAATLAITSAPIAGTNATISNTYAIWSQSGAVRIDDASASIVIRSVATSAANAAIYFNQTSFSASNVAIRGNATSTQINGPGTSVSQGVDIRVAGNPRYSIRDMYHDFVVGTVTSSAITPYTFTSSANTGQTASTEIPGFNVNLSATRTWATGAITTQREFLIQAPTYAFSGASVITDAATLSISAAPIAGTNATITNAYSIWSQSGGIRFDDGTGYLRILSIPSITTTVGLFFNQATPSSSNWALRADTSNVTLNAPVTSVLLAVAGGTRFTLNSTNVSFNPAAASAGSTTSFAFVSPSDANQTAGVEKITFSISSATVQSNGSSPKTTQRFVVIGTPTYSFTSTQTITNAATLAITAAPIAGTNATITNSYALWIQGGTTRLDGNLSFNNASNIILGTTTGTKIGTSTTEKIGFWNATPVTQPTGWGTPTNTLTRTTFDSGTVTLRILAEEVAALITDLKNIGIIGA